MINKDLLRETLAYIEANPSEWDQKKWICGSVACFAGRACLLSGDKPVPREDSAESLHVEVGDSHEYVMNRAAQLLGLSQGDANRLFCGDNDLSDLCEIVEELCA